MSTEAPTRQLRWQRNVAGLLAMVILLGSLAVTLPRSLSRYRSTRMAQEQLAALQGEISRLQLHIVDLQGRIVDLRKRIMAAQPR